MSQEARKYLSSERYRLKSKYDYRRFQSLTEYVAQIRQERGISAAEARKMAFRIIPKEAFYQKKILEALGQEYPNGRFRKVAQGFGSKSGEPDVDGLLGMEFGSKSVYVEVKRPLIGEATPLQVKAVREIRQAGGCAMIASYPDEVVAAVGAYLRGEPYWKGLTGCTEAVAEGEDECLE